MRHARSSALLAALVLGSALAGCASSSEPVSSEAPSSDAPRETVSESPSPAAPSSSPEPEPTDVAPDLVAAAEGLGPLVIGSPVTAAGGALVAYTTEDCTTGYWATGGAHTSPSGGYAHEGGASFTIWADGESAPVQRIDVLDPAIETDRGIAIGDPETEVQGA